MYIHHIDKTAPYYLKRMMYLISNCPDPTLNTTPIRSYHRENKSVLCSLVATDGSGV